MTSRRLHNQGDRGSAMIELPAALVGLCILALCFTALGQMLLDYHNVSGAARAAARYATKSDYDPTVSPASSSRRPTTDQVVAFAKQAASPLDPNTVDVVVSPDTVAGNGVDVAVSNTVSGGAYGLVTGTANTLLGLIGMKQLTPKTMHAHATALYE